MGLEENAGVLVGAGRGGSGEGAGSREQRLGGGEASLDPSMIYSID